MLRVKHLEKIRTGHMNSYMQPILVIDDRAPIKLMARIYGRHTMSLQDHVTRNTIGRKCGMSSVLSFEEAKELVN
jgi:hypothetical protein